MTLYSMKNGHRIRVFAVNDDGSATENGVAIDDFGTLFMLLRWSGWTCGSEMTIPFPAQSKTEAKPRRKANRRRMPRQLNGYRHDWLDMVDEAYAEDNWVTV